MMSSRPSFQWLIAVTVASFVASLVVSESFAQFSRNARGGYGGSGNHGGFNNGSFRNTASANPNLGRPGNLSLVVAQTQEGHDGVSDLLGQLRRLQDQQVKNEVRFTTVNDSFFERQGVGFGFNLRGADPAGGRGVVGLDPTGQATPNGDLQFRQGGAATALPPFGGHDPAGDATFGFANRGGEGDLLFNFFGGQGSSRSMVTQAPIVVIPNGGQGSFSDTNQIPFVTGVVPVVGGMDMASLTGYGPHLLAPPQQSALQQKLQQLKYDQLRQAAQKSTTQQDDDRNAVRPAPAGDVRLGSGGGASGGPSSADRGDLSVAEIRRRQANSDATEDAELAGWIERARGAEALGKMNVAAIYYKMAARRAEGEQKQLLIRKVREVEGQ